MSDSVDSPTLAKSDEDLMWTLFDYSAWSALGSQDIANIEELQAAHAWAEMDISLDVMSSTFLQYEI